MTREQEEHLQRLKEQFCRQVDAKYRKGQAEHGGDLWTKNTLWLIDQAILEAIDQYVYLRSVRERLVGNEP